MGNPPFLDCPEIISSSSSCENVMLLAVYFASNFIFVVKGHSLTHFSQIYFQLKEFSETAKEIGDLVRTLDCTTATV